MYEINQRDEDIDTQLNRASDQFDKGGSRYPGMSYEQGVRDAIDWINGQSDDPPLGDEYDEDDES
jgi:predicted secreted Zn-dependent protease